VKRCSKCKLDKPLEEFPRRSRSPSGRASWCSECKSAHVEARRSDPAAREIERQYQAAFYQQKKNARREELFARLGGKCECCGEDNYAFLTLEHRQGVPEEHLAPEHRRKLRNGGGRRSTVDIYRLVLAEGAPREKYGLLCFNCNVATHRYGICPHRVESGVIASQSTGT
jgi:hypothetical protein